ncbi:MarR family winged helix-turn-helix transcriptional regulator [Amycolatopsis aidingensis]|uniref:MarR family winged helix-turn-helix transcriptional regulator n=1 Tax=Amycolatopsis aidingensis TaxID=2842453 RepID=UPI001C0D77BE|nr:MarR family winged helix-turn-helix transcriptional regulator [Amycolatopsis aidingensis]
MTEAEEVRLELVRELRAVAQVQHAWTARIWPEELGLHPAAVGLLAELSDVGECRPSELARRRLVDLSVVSRQITQLLAAELVERRPAPEDGRAALVRISVRGAAELARWRELYLGLVGRALDNWTERELRGLVERLRAVNTDLRAVLGPEDGEDQAGRVPADHAGPRAPWQVSS